MAVEHFLQSIQVTRLKGMRMNNRDLILFEESKHLTALMGPNGFGKSSILHVLAASFRPTKIRRQSTASDAGETHHYSEFLPSTPDEKWTGTEVMIGNRIKRGDDTEIKPIVIQKNETGTWQPQQANKIERETYFIGVSSALPEVEIKRTSDELEYTDTEEQTDVESNKIREHLGYIFNRKYSNLFDHTTSANTQIIGLTHNGTRYSSLSMGAGEQRVFKILKTIILAQKHALILIDELDLLLHTEALDKLLRVMGEVASHKSLQIIFTSHRESILLHSDRIAIRHVYKSNEAPFNTHWFVDTKPGAIERLTGKLNTTLSICCEDDVAEAIINRVAEQLGIAQHIEIKLFGAWKNCFTLVAALAIEDKCNENSLFVLDGDVAECKTPGQWKTTLENGLLTGTSKIASERRKSALKTITQFSPPAGASPERTLYDMLRSGVKAKDKVEQKLIDAFIKLEAVTNSHDYVLEPLRQLGIKREIGLARVVAIASRSKGWGNYVKSVRGWLRKKLPTLVENQNAGM